ncbi:Ger(x)C family spore germination protein [Metabacillus litoralis]|uniref:Ger(x)C family spore germination protein n=1 Tax=Metabacillus litoralis TaxID=152268 RepID=UPI00203FE2ED|nr:Ger(x)C family spore germination protein [Metabacillus litoralis]MCM3654755.1 Ger(x)C family spore germination protein [Metabacillus litoralis]
MSCFKWMKKKSIPFILLLFFTMVFLAGCWDRTEVNDIALIMAAGIDKSDDEKIELSVQVFIPKPSESGQQEGMASGSNSTQTFVKSAVGITLADAMSRLQEKLTRQIFWGQNEVLIIGEELAKLGLSDHIDFWMRHSGPRVRADVFIAEGMAKEVLQSIPELERDSAKQLHELVKTNIGVKVTVKDLSQMLSGESGAAVLPWVEKMPSENSDVQKGQEVPFIKGAAVFKGDKMVGKLNDNVTRGILWPRNEIKSGVITTSLENEEGYVSLNLLRSQNQLIPHITDGKWSIVVKTNADLEIIQNTTNLNSLNPKFSKKVKHKVVQDIEEREKLALSEAQKNLNADIFGFAESFQREYPEIWKREKGDWNEIFQNVDVSFETTVNIKRTGLVSEEASKRGEEE